MDISGIAGKKRTLWIFDDTFVNDTIGVFIDAKDYLTNANKKEIVFVLDVEGNEYNIMPFKIDYVDFVEKYGSDTDKWIGKQFKLTRNAKRKYVMVPIEESI